MQLSLKCTRTLLAVHVTLKSSAPLTSYAHTVLHSRYANPPPPLHMHTGGVLVLKTWV